MGQRISCLNIATESECVYSLHPSTPLQLNNDTPRQENHQLDESRVVPCEEDGGSLVKEKKKEKKKSSFWRKLFRFSRPRAGRGEKVKQVDSEKVKPVTEAEPSTDGKSLYFFCDWKKKNKNDHHSFKILSLQIYVFVKGLKRFCVFLLK